MICFFLAAASGDGAGARKNAHREPRDGAPVARRRSGAPAPCTAAANPEGGRGGPRKPREAQRRSQRRAKRAAGGGRSALTSRSGSQRSGGQRTSKARAHAQATGASGACVRDACARHRNARERFAAASGR